jgi:hypothetical protein
VTGGCLTVLTLAGAGAQTVPPAPAKKPAESIQVNAPSRKPAGGGLMKPEQATKSVSTVSNVYIATQSSLQNAYQYIALAPGANVAATDPYGLSEQGSITIRGLGQDELGYVLEGMPLNDIGYYVGYPAQFLDSENISEVALAQGSADLDSPVISAAGGLMNISMQDPLTRPGGNLDLAYGSYHANREFLRLDSGLLGNSGVRAFVSFSHTAADNWDGFGRDKRTHVDFKIVKEWEGDNRISLVGTYHDGITTSYVLPSLAQFQEYGRGGPDVFNGTYYPGALNDDTNYWPLHVGTFRVFYMSAPSHLTLGDGWTYTATPYWQYGYGNSPYGAVLSETGNYNGTAGPYSISLPNAVNGQAEVLADYLDLQYRAGFNQKLMYTSGHNSLEFGYWYDYDDEEDSEPYSLLSPEGLPGDIWQDTDRGLIKLPNGSFLDAGEDHVETQVNMLFIGDTLTLLDGRLRLEAGFKEAMVSRDGTNQLPGPQYHAILNSAEPLPRLGGHYQIDGENQVFFSVDTNFRTPSEATLFNEYCGGVLCSATNTNLKTEYSISEELGYRYQGVLFTGSATLFNYNFTNRQIATLVGGNLINESINAGGQISQGVDVEAGTRPWNHLSPYVSGEYLNAVISNDIQVGGDYLPTAGKIAVRSPRLQGAIGLNYDDGCFFAQASVKYVGSQYATFMDDEKILSHAQGDLALGYRLPKIGLVARPEVKLNLINITDTNFLSGVANPTTNAQPTIGRFGTVIAGSAPTYYVAGGFAAILSLKQAF